MSTLRDILLIALGAALGMTGTATYLLHRFKRQLADPPTEPQLKLTLPPMAPGQTHWHIPGLGDVRPEDPSPRLTNYCPRCKEPMFVFQEWCRRCGERLEKKPEPRTRAERLDEWQ